MIHFAGDGHDGSVLAHRSCMLVDECARAGMLLGHACRSIMKRAGLMGETSHSPPERETERAMIACVCACMMRCQQV